jgi:PPOX class probable F420-dependent enzyme
MTHDRWRGFLQEGTRTAKVATVRHDCRPHVVPVWFVLDGDDLVFTTGAGTVKGRAMRRDPRVGVCVDDENPPYAFVTIEARATLSEDLGQLRRYAAAIGGRYMGADRAEEFGARNAVPGELLVRVTPVHVLAEDGIAD